MSPIGVRGKLTNFQNNVFNHRESSFLSRQVWNQLMDGRTYIHFSLSWAKKIESSRQAWQYPDNTNYDSWDNDSPRRQITPKGWVWGKYENLKKGEHSYFVSICSYSAGKSPGHDSWCHAAYASLCICMQAVVTACKLMVTLGKFGYPGLPSVTLGNLGKLGVTLVYLQ